MPVFLPHRLDLDPGVENVGIEFELVGRPELYRGDAAQASVPLGEHIVDNEAGNAHE
ncbi:hypothetical protein D3C81_2255610 [compost metagenome]